MERPNIKDFEENEIYKYIMLLEEYTNHLENEIDVLKSDNIDLLSEINYQ